MNKHFVFDTNTLVSAFLFKNSNPRKAIDRALETGKIFVSTEAHTELEEVFLRPKFDKYLPQQVRLLILREFAELAISEEVTETIAECRDPKDNKFLGLAITVAASCIITGDNDLLVLHPFRGIPILNASDFLNRF